MPVETADKKFGNSQQYRGFVARDEGLFDTEGYKNGSAVPAVRTFFINNQQFNDTTLTQKKTKGRDHNMSTPRGGLSQGEGLVVYGLSAKAAAYAQALNVANGPVYADDVRKLWEILSFDWSFSNQPFLIGQCRDWPLQGSHPVAYSQGTAADGMLTDPFERGIRDITVDGMAYELEPGAEFQIELTATAATLPTPTLDTYFTIKLDGPKLTGVRE